MRPNMKRLLIALLIPWSLWAQGVRVGGGTGLAPGSPGTIVSGAGGGTAQAQTATPNPAITSYISTGVLYCFTPVANNTGAAPTLNWSGLGAKPTVKNSNGIAPLVANDWVLGVPACHIYDGTEFILINPATTTSSNSGTVLHTVGSLTLNSCVVGNGGADIKVDTGQNCLNDILPAATRAGDMIYCQTFSGVCTAWSLLPGNNSGTQFLQETNAGVPSWGSSAGTVAWSSLTNPASSLGLTMASNLTTLNYTTALSHAFDLKNTTPASVGTSQGSPFLGGCGRAWTGSDVESCWNMSILPGNGVNAPLTIALGVSGTSTGITTFTTPGPVQSGSGSGAGSEWSLPNAGTIPVGFATAGQHNCYNDSTTTSAPLCSFNGGTTGRLPLEICPPVQIALSTSAIGSGVRVANTAACTGLSTATDTINCTLVGDTNAVTGYGGTTVLTLKPYLTTNTINVDQLNTTGSSITPGAASINCKGWR